MGGALRRGRKSSHFANFILVCKQSTSLTLTHQCPSQCSQSHTPAATCTDTHMHDGAPWGGEKSKLSPLWDFRYSVKTALLTIAALQHPWDNTKVTLCTHGKAEAILCHVPYFSWFDLRRLHKQVRRKVGQCARVKRVGKIKRGWDRQCGLVEVVAPTMSPLFVWSSSDAFDKQSRTRLSCYLVALRSLREGGLLEKEVGRGERWIEG